MPAVSVVIPAHNGGDLLKRAVEGVIRQSYTDWECIVVDDGGAEDLRWVDVADKRVRRLSQPNAGVSVARNRGVALASAPLVAFCDQDDEWLPRKLEAQLAAWTEGTVCSVTGFSWEFSDGHSAASAQPTRPTWLAMIRDGHLCLSSLLVDRMAFWSVGGFDPLLAMEQDWLLFVLLLRQYPGGMRVVDEVLVRYFLHETNGSRDYFRAYLERKAVLARLASAGDEQVRAACRDGQALNRRLRTFQAIDAGREAARRGDWSGVTVAMSRALRWKPAAAVSAVRRSL